MIVLSSTEVGFYAFRKCACQCIGLMNLTNDFDINLKTQIMIDAHVAFGVVQKRNFGKLHHIDVQWLWLQERMQNGEIKAAKANGKDNPTDLVTTHLSSEDMAKHLVKWGFELRSNKFDKSLKINVMNHNQEDHWTNDQKCLIKLHQLPWAKLLTIYQTIGAPNMSLLTPTRVTQGKHFDNNDDFNVQDNWICRNQQWRDLGRQWIGRIVFIPKLDNVEQPQRLHIPQSDDKQKDHVDNVKQLNEFKRGKPIDNQQARDRDGNHERINR